MSPPVALSIAGSDSGGGAGIQADVATISSLGVHAATVVTALTAQSTTEVRSVSPVDPSFVAEQLETVLDDIAVSATKTGMLATGAIVELVAQIAAERGLQRLVVDPVMVSSTGARLLDAGAEDVYRRALLPLALVATPNVEEAEVLLGAALPDLAAVHRAAPDLLALGPRWVVVTGVADSEGGRAVDVVVGPDGPVDMSAPRSTTANDHGTGCTFSAATAAWLALGATVPEALARAKTYVRDRLDRSAGWKIGSGRGPVDHTFG